MSAEVHSHAEAAHDRLDQHPRAVLEALDATPRPHRSIAMRSGVDVVTTDLVLAELLRSGHAWRYGTILPMYARADPHDDQRRIKPAPA